MSQLPEITQKQTDAMAIHVDWDNTEKTILRYSFPSDWTWEDFFDALKQAKALIDTAPGEVGVIMDGKSNEMRFPPYMLTNFRKALENCHKKTRAIVIVVDSGFLRVIVNMLVRIANKSGQVLRMADSLDEARKIVTDTLLLST